MQEVSGSTPLSSTIVTSKHRKVFGGTATSPHIVISAPPSFAWRIDNKDGLYSQAWDRRQREISA
jgi:hypothetical protein